MNGNVIQNNVTREENTKGFPVELSKGMVLL